MRKIIEETKQHHVDIMKGDEELGLYELGQKVGHSVQVEETLEEAAKELYPTKNTGSMFMANRDELNNLYKQEGFIDGYNKAKEDYEVVSSVREVHQYKLGLDDGYNTAKERMYSEEEVLKLFLAFSDDRTFLKEDVAIQWFDKNKKQ